MKQFLIVFTLLPLIIFGQSTDELNPKRLSVGFIFSPDYGYRKLSPDNSFPAQIISKNRDTLEIPKFCFTAGLGLLIPLSNRFSFETGLLYSNKGYKTKTYPLIWDAPTGQPESGIITQNTFIYHYNYLDIPAKLNYFVSKKRLRIFISGGISTNLFLFQKRTLILEFPDRRSEIHNTSSNGISRLNLAILAGLGVNYDLSKRFTLRIEPTYRRSINSIVNAPIRGYLYSIGVNAGVFYRL